MSEDFGSSAQLRYVDFDSPELKQEFPEIYRKIEDGIVDVGSILIDGETYSIWEVPYSRMMSEFERLGATRIDMVT